MNTVKLYEADAYLGEFTATVKNVSVRQESTK